MVSHERTGTVGEDTVSTPYEPECKNDETQGVEDWQSDFTAIEVAIRVSLSCIGTPGVLTTDGERVEGVPEEECGRHNNGSMSIHSSASRCQAKKRAIRCGTTCPGLWRWFTGTKETAVWLSSDSEVDDRRPEGAAEGRLFACVRWFSAGSCVQWARVINDKFQSPTPC